MKICTLLFGAAALTLVSGCDLFDTANNRAANHLQNINNNNSVIVIRVAYENQPGEPFDLGMRKWQYELEKRSFGTIKLELYPSEQLGSKMSVLQRMMAGENLATLADPAVYAELGQKDMGIMFGPYLCRSWEEVFNLFHSIWFQKQTLELIQKFGLRIISTDWAYGVRHMLTKEQILRPEDIEGLRLRVPGNAIQMNGLKVFGAVPVAMSISQVAAAMNAGEIDGLENPISVMYKNGLHNSAKYLLLTGHVFNSANIVISQKTWLSLNASQQKLLVDSCNRAARYFNTVNEATELNAIDRMREAGVKITRPTPRVVSTLREKAVTFYSLPDFSDWTPGLYENVNRIKSKTQNTNINLLMQAEGLNVSYSDPAEQTPAETTLTAVSVRNTHLGNLADDDNPDGTIAGESHTSGLFIDSSIPVVTDTAGLIQKITGLHITVTSTDSVGSEFFRIHLEPVKSSQNNRKAGDRIYGEIYEPGNIRENFTEKELQEINRLMHIVL